MNRREEKLVVIALGGNALLRRGQNGTFEEQYENVKQTCKILADLIENGYKLAITHGNGPQVGATILRHDAGFRVYGVPPFPMDVCGAETQGFIGYMIQQALTNELLMRGIKKNVITIITRVVVDKNDPDFSNPSKPVGAFYTEKEMMEIKKIHPEYIFKEDKARGGWRRVVPSPDPKYLVEMPGIKALVDAGYIVISSGGGGIPVIEENSEMRGVEAVIDKDLAGERLATSLGASKFIILTDVDGIYVDYDKSTRRKIDVIRVEELKKLYDEGHFPPGSMGPKVKAAIRFIESGGDEAIIADLKDLMNAIRGKAGTHIIR
ncbi:MAG: carbamate kinase [Aigarchaeota archaeon]|nr:carbamate kinase [Aigarchaeota archaeon]MDW7986049.1 carbamate kinase [Nitrososphaerota archaeon]